MPARSNEYIYGIGKCKQTDLATANTAAGIIRLNNIEVTGLDPILEFEDDRADMGKGHPYATALIPSHYNTSGSIKKYLSSEFAAWVMAHSLKPTKTGTTHLTYTCVPHVPATDGREPTAFSVVKQCRPGASAVDDFVNIGCCIEGWTLSVGSGPGRQNAMLSADIVGSGKVTEPSTITIPAVTTEHLLPASSLTLTINSIDYVTAKNFVSLEAAWKNNIQLDDGFYPGSGTQNSAQIRGRMEIGDPEASIKFTARYVYGSTEFTKLKAMTEGTAAIVLTYDTNNSLTLTFQRVAFRTVERSNVNGVVTVDVTCTPMWHSTNGILTAVAKCDLDGIAEAES